MFSDVSEETFFRRDFSYSTDRPRGRDRSRTILRAKWTPSSRSAMPGVPASREITGSEACGGHMHP
jgi:hypothetical protein